MKSKDENITWWVNYYVSTKAFNFDYNDKSYDI